MPTQTFEDALLLANMPPEVAANFREVIIPFTLRPHQILGLQCGLYWDRFGLYHDVRTGKTVVMQLLAIFYAHYHLRSTFILPPILFDQFQEELAKIKGHLLKATTIEGDAARKREMLQSFALHPDTCPDLVITTAQIFAGPFGKQRKATALQNWWYFAKFSDVLFFDECHLGLQDEESLTFRAIENYIKASPTKRLVLSSGTPLRTELRSAYPQIRLKTPDLYTSRRHFDGLHVNFAQMIVSFTRANGSLGNRQVPKIDSYKEVELLAENFYKKAHRVSKFDVLTFATPNFQIVPIHLSAKHQAIYKQLLADQILETDTELLDFRQPSKLRHFAQRLITSPELAGEEISDNAVLKALTSIIGTANVDDTGKLIIFANYNSSVKYLKEKFKSYNPAIIYGGDDSTAETNRKEVARFKRDRECNIAIINPQAGGVGLTLGDVCQTAVFAEPVTSPGLLDQAAARILLDGQTEPSVIYLLDVRKTFYSEAVKRLLEKEEEVQDVMKDRKTLLNSILPR